MLNRLCKIGQLARKAAAAASYSFIVEMYQWQLWLAQKT